MLRRTVKRFFILLLCAAIVLYQWLNLEMNSTYFDTKSLKRGAKVVKPTGPTATADEFYELGLIRSHDDLTKRREGYAKYAFNILASDRIGFHRQVLDTRDETCAKKVVSSLPIKASVIVCFYNEAMSTLLRTLHSIIERTPSELLREVIVIDDHSSHPEMLFQLPRYLKKHFPTSISFVRLNKRAGLMRARQHGATLARGEVLVFLDSHCEVGVDWLQPLMFRIHNNSKTVVCPVIDTIDSHTFTYRSSALVRGGFNWGMHFNWENIPMEEGSESEPYMTPTMAGGLFAIDRQYFFHLGGYDPGMEIWGGENLEMSFRVWMCGGRMEIHPCSRVGHVFRSRRPYPGGEAITKNTVRLVEVWLDDFKKHFYNLQPHLRSLDVDVHQRRQLRRQLHCRTFKWYLNHVYPQIPIPGVRAGAVEHRPPVPTYVVKKRGKLRNTSSQLCLKVTKGQQKKGQQKQRGVVLVPCNQTVPVEYSTLNDLRLEKRLCLDVAVAGQSPVHPGRASREPVYGSKCHGGREGQEWRGRSGSYQFYNPSLGMCLEGNEEGAIFAQICDIYSQHQKWSFRG